LQGDRNGDLGALAVGRWDAVIDTCAYRPAEVERLADALQGRVGACLLVSSISVYAGFAQPNDEPSPLGRIDDPHTEVIDARSYGPLKALCEAAARERFGDAGTLILRPGLIVGPHDPTGRFTHWPLRVARGGEVLAPGRPQRPVQFIDARDLADWCLRLISDGTTGSFNAIGDTLPMEHLLTTCREVSGSDARFTWFDDQALGDAKLEPWSELPLWIPEDDPAFGGMLLGSNERARAAGLRLRPLAETVRDTLA
jgi:2'-hydroxyisoflavone reductase